MSEQHELSVAQKENLAQKLEEFTKQIATISFKVISIDQVMQIYAQIQLSILLLSSGASEPIGFTVPLGGKHYRFQGTLTEVKDSASPETDG